MFYAHFVLSKKGPLARIWLAAHWDKKLTRAHVFETNISSSVEAILEPKVKLALRTSGHLLLGVVRIYSRQAKYLLADCNEAFVKIKMAFRPGAEVQEESHRDSCSLAAITLADNMHDFESTLAELTEMDPYSISVNQSRPEDITMREEFGEPNLGRPDDDFGDSTFEEGGEREFVGDHSAGDVMEMDEHHEADLSLTNELVRSQPSQVYTEMPPSVSMTSNDGFGDMMDVDYDSGENLDRNMEEAVMFQESTHEKTTDTFSRIDSEMADTTMENTIVDVIETIEPSEVPLTILACVPEEMVTDENMAPEEMTEALSVHSPQATQLQTLSPAPQTPLPMPVISNIIEIQTTTAPIMTALTTVMTTTTPVTPMPATTNTITKRLPQFVLPPVQQASRVDHRRTPKRKRRLLIDEHKSIPSDVMKMQMQDTSEITTRLDLAPPTRKLMLWKETGSVDSLFSTPGRAIPSRVLQRLFYRNLKTVPVPNDSPDGLPVFKTCKIVNIVPPVSVMEPVAVVATEAVVERVEEDGGIGQMRRRTEQEEEEEEQAQRDLYRIVEDQQEEQRARHHSQEQQMHPGACSSYSANYDCFSGQATPRREHDDPEEVEEEVQPRVECQEEERVAIENEDRSMVAERDEGHSMYSQMPIEEARMSAGVSELGMATFSNDGFDTTFNDRSIVSISVGPDSRSNILDYSTTTTVPGLQRDEEEDQDRCLEVADIAEVVVTTDDGTNDDNDGQNKLQNTMLALDNELDIIDRQFPIEMTQEGLEKRSEIMLNVLQNAIKRDNQVVFQHLTVSNNKKQAASKFYTLLLLGKQKAITLHQDTPFSNIIITPYSC